MDAAPRSVPSLGEVTYLINHVFLPPKLPQEDDFSLRNEEIIIDVVLASLSKFKTNSFPSCEATIDSAIAMVTSLRDVRDSAPQTRSVNEERFRNALVDLCDKGGTIPLHIRAQNCGVLISRVDRAVHFEAFELSALNKDVVSTKGRLRRSFPGCAVAVDLETFEKPSFMSTIAQTLTKMSYQTAIGTIPQVRKAGQLHDENRDTTHPKMVTELFMAFLSSVGEPVRMSRLWKNTRDEVLWDDCYQPWRRSPLWLLVRVALQLHFSRSEFTSRNTYKLFMAFFMSSILNFSQQRSVSSDLIYAMNAKLVRRLLKLDSDVDEPSVHFVQNAMQKAHELLNTRWENIMDQDRQDFDLARLMNMDFDRDVQIGIPLLDQFITSVSNRSVKKAPSASRSASAAVGLFNFAPAVLPTWPAYYTEAYKLYNLKAVETWVALHLNSWLTSNKDNPKTCQMLSGLITQYHGIANHTYLGNPEEISIMLLTILELWIALDQTATHVCKMLKDYAPHIPREFLECLLLPFKSQMERLRRAEVYLKGREARGAKFPSPHIFRDFGTADAFSVRYFDQSPEHQDLFKSIEAQASWDRANKKNRASAEENAVSKLDATSQYG